MKNALGAFALLAAITMAPGCAVNRATAMVDASADLDKVRSVHVTKLAKDERGVDRLIADKLRARGLKATAGPAKPEGGIDAVVTYADKWMWDITMYMLELTVTFRDPATDFPIATGNSYHTSLSRKSPEEMVDEVIANIYAKGKGK